MAWALKTGEWVFFELGGLPLFLLSYILLPLGFRSSIQEIQTQYLITPVSFLKPCTFDGDVL